MEPAMKTDRTPRVFEALLGIASLSAIIGAGSVAVNAALTPAPVATVETEIPAGPGTILIPLADLRFKVWAV